MALVSEVWRRAQVTLEAAHAVGPNEGFQIVEHLMGDGSRRRWELELLEFPADHEAALEQCVQRRMAGEPLAQILGHAWFYGRRFTVTPDVLIPRPDTETLVEACLQRVQAGWRVAEVGVGSGCIIGTLLAERGDMTAVGIEISAAAAAVAQGNLAALSVEGRAEIRVQDGLNGTPEHFNMLVSNPPYITDAEWELLEGGVKDFEPRLALTGGEPNPDGLLFYRRLASWGRDKVQQHGWLCMETGWQQAQAVRELLQEQTSPEGDVWHEISVLKDLGGRERVVCARRR